jgi:hypothetical protein
VCFFNAKYDSYLLEPIGFILTAFQIPARILRDLADVIAPLLTLIFQKSLDEGNIPNDWRTANVTAIFKKGE